MPPPKPSGIAASANRFFSSGLSTLYLSIVLMSLNGLFAQSIHLDSNSITHLRSVIAALGLAMLLGLRGSNLLLPNKKTTLIVYSLGFLLGLHWTTFFLAMQVSSVAVGIIALFSYPVITVLIEPLFHHSRPKGVDILAAFIVFIGIMIMASGDSTNAGDLRQGVSWGVLSALLFSLRNTSQKYLLHHVTSSSLMLHQVIATAILFAVFVDWPRVSHLDSHNWVLLVLLGLISTASAHTLFSISLKRLSAKSVALISCLQPLLASIFAWLLLDEVPSLYVMFGGSIVLAVATYESLKRTA